MAGAGGGIHGYFLVTLKISGKRERFLPVFPHAKRSIIGRRSWQCHCRCNWCTRQYTPASQRALTLSDWYCPARSANWPKKCTWTNARPCSHCFQGCLPLPNVSSHGKALARCAHVPQPSNQRTPRKQASDLSCAPETELCVGSPRRKRST